MKISTTALIFLALGISVIAVFSLNMAYSQQSQEQSRLNAELAMAQLRLEKYPAQDISSQKEELESRLARAKSQLKDAKDSLYWSTQSIEASDALLALAEASNVEVTEISSAGMTTEVLEEITFSALTLTVTVEGEVLDLINFVHNWTKEYPTGMVQSVEITVPEPPEEEEEEEMPSATIDLRIYTYEGD